LSAWSSGERSRVYVADEFLSKEWPASLSETFAQAIEKATSADLIVKGPTGYALTDKGRKIAR
jgi:hypothetical protein